MFAYINSVKNKNDSIIRQFAMAVVGVAGVFRI